MKTCILINVKFSLFKAWFTSLYCLSCWCSYVSWYVIRVLLHQPNTRKNGPSGEVPRIQQQFFYCWKPVNLRNWSEKLTYVHIIRYVSICNKMYPAAWTCQPSLSSHPQFIMYLSCIMRVNRRQSWFANRRLNNWMPTKLPKRETRISSHSTHE